ncbi:MAG: hypothetical protein AB7U73_19755 [Pirellulales bacterium]
MPEPALSSLKSDANGLAADCQRNWRVERRADGAILVRVPSWDRAGRRLPDAVFSFRNGDPQYLRWDEFLRQRSE